MVAKDFQGSGLQLPCRLACTKKCHVTVSKPSKTDTIGMGNNNKPCPHLGPAMITSIFAAVQSGLCRSLGVKAVIVSQSFILNLSSNQKRRLKATSTSSRSSMLSSFCQILPNPLNSRPEILKRLTVQIPFHTNKLLQDIFRSPDLATSRVC